PPPTPKGTSKSPWRRWTTRFAKWQPRGTADAVPLARSPAGACTSAAVVRPHHVAAPPAERGVAGILAHVPAVAPAALALLARRPQDPDHRLPVLLHHGAFRPGRAGDQRHLGDDEERRQLVLQRAELRVVGRAHLEDHRRLLRRADELLVPGPLQRAGDHPAHREQPLPALVEGGIALQLHLGPAGQVDALGFL